MIIPFAEVGTLERSSDSATSIDGKVETPMGHPHGDVW